MRTEASVEGRLGVAASTVGDAQWQRTQIAVDRQQWQIAFDAAAEAFAPIGDFAPTGDDEAGGPDDPS